VIFDILPPKNYFLVGVISQSGGLLLIGGTPSPVEK